MGRCCTGVALRLMDQPEEAEEVLQETLLTVYEKIHTFDERSALTTWLYRITVNTALMRLRAKARMPEDAFGALQGPDFTAQGQHAREVADWALPPEETLLRREALATLQQAIAHLPALYRAVYILAEIEGLSHQEIASILDLTVGPPKLASIGRGCVYGRRLPSMVWNGGRPQHEGLDTIHGEAPGLVHQSRSTRRHPC
jgi:RNA polymerase sigma-70 factor (ECF subfamily)